MSERSVCPDVEEWRRFHAGDVTEVQLETLAAHQEGCASCRALLATLDEPGQGIHEKLTAPRAEATCADLKVEKPAAGYAVERKLAEGGMGCVWVARDAEVGRQVALKELKPEFEDDAGMRERFLAEARVTGQLEHPGIVPVYQMVERPDRPPAYAMRLVRGRTLLEAVREFHTKGGVGSDTVGLRDLLGAFVSVCNTLAYAHSRGVLHRDLKGENIVLGPFGEVVVLDWGVAKVVGAAEAKGSAVRPLPTGRPEATAAVAAPGTVAYMLKP